MLKRISAFLASGLFSIASLVVLTPAFVHAAGTATWDGGGTDTKFSTAANWAGDVAPIDGDALVFPALSTRQAPINDTSLTYAGITFTGASGSCSSGPYNWYAITGTQTLNVSGNIANGMTGSCSSVDLTLNLSISGNITITGSMDIGSGSNTIALGSSQITIAANSYVGLSSPVTGTSGSSITVTALGAVYLIANPAFDGQFIANGSINAFAGSFGTTTGNTVVNSGGVICYSHLGQSTSIAEPFVFNTGTYSSNYGVLFAVATCGAGGGQPAHTAEVTTLSGPITIVQNTLFDTLGTIHVTGAITGNFTIAVPNGSVGLLDLPSGVVSAPVHEVTIADGDVAAGTYVSVGNKETYIINGTRGNVGIAQGGILKGHGTVGTIDVGAGGTLAPGNSPGCLNSGNLTFVSGSTYDFEVGGPTACTEYDQTKVTGTVDLGDGTLNTILYNNFKPVKGQSYTIIDNDVADAVVGTFKNLAEGATFTVGGYVLKISYVGGTGNDVVLTVQSVPATPDTGFQLLSSHPIITLITTTLLAAGIALLARRYRVATSR